MYFFASIMVGAFVFANLVVAVVVTNLVSGPTSTKHLYNIFTMLADVVPIVYKCFVFVRGSF